jgi:two-component system, cell cycle sensor histidine kinase and response regulator CckA
MARCLVDSPFPSLGTTILVVDDERIARRVAYRILTEEGFRVFEASSAEEALDVLRLAHSYVNLILLDVVMPATDGVTLGERMVAQWPNVQVLYMSAHPAEILAEHGLGNLQVPFLAKPYTRDELLAKVREGVERHHQALNSYNRPGPDTRSEPFE